MTHVDNWKDESLLPLIIKYIEEGSIKINDEWKGFNLIQEPYFTPMKVNHSKKIVNPTNGAQTQRTDSLWNICQQWLRNKHVRERLRLEVSRVLNLQKLFWVFE